MSVPAHEMVTAIIKAIAPHKKRPCVFDPNTRLRANAMEILMQEMPTMTTSE